MTQKNKINTLSISLNILYALAVAGVVFFLFNIFSFSKSGAIDDAVYKTKRHQYGVYAMPMPDSIYFAGERVPIENFDTRESLDKELHKVALWHSEMFLYLKRANRYFPDIEKILKKNNVPDDFKYICVTESGLTNVVSPAGAAGFWQFMESTGKSYGLIINKEIDERYNYIKATKAACEYLKRRYSKYGSWALVAAAYNAGDGGLAKFMDYQKEKSYYDLALYEETGRYLYRAIAMKLIMENPQNYGFYYRQRDLYPVLDTKQIEVDSTITDIAKFAKAQGMTYKVFKMLNPWLRKHKLSNENKHKYSITILSEEGRKKLYYPKEEIADKQVDTDDNETVPKDNFENKW